MELSPRKQAVLKALINAYIKTGEPIGSKNLTALLPNAPSSATLRNEMSELCELGLLHQPHTSAGRVPTSRGYRLYVNSLMTENEITSEEKQRIDEALKSLNCDPEGIPAEVTRLLQSLTGLPAIACLITEKQPRVKRIELLPIGRSSVMLLVITNDGRTRNRVFRHSGFSSEGEAYLKTIVEKRIKGRAVNEITKAYMQGVISECGIYMLELMPIFTAVLEAVSEIEQSGVTLSSENALYNICGDELTARKITALIKMRSPIISILEEIGENVTAVFGADTEYNELNGEAIVAARFKGSDKYRGYIGIIGPDRISYEHIMPCIKYISGRMTEIMTKAQKDMED